MVKWIKPIICVAVIAAITIIKPLLVNNSDFITVNRKDIVDFVIDDINGDGVHEILILRQASAAARGKARYDEIYGDGKIDALPPEAAAEAEKSNLRFANEFIICRFSSDNFTADNSSEVFPSGKPAASDESAPELFPVRSEVFPSGKPAASDESAPELFPVRKDSVLFEKELRLEKIYSMDFSSIRPMMIKTGDIDGDGQLEISICMFKTTEFHPIYAKRPFIYQWSEVFPSGKPAAPPDIFPVRSEVFPSGKPAAPPDIFPVRSEGRLIPVWLGSRLSKPFDDYIFTDVNRDGIDELVSIETTKDGRKIVSCYNWWDFGFEMMGESKAFDNMDTLRKEADPGIIRVTVADESGTRDIRLIYKESEHGDRFYNAGSLDSVK